MMRDQADISQDARVMDTMTTAVFDIILAPALG